jgi:hypothetical protein
VRAVAAGLVALTVAGCGFRGADLERARLDRFFAASRLRDLTALRHLSTVVFEPAADGIITSYEITGVVARGAAEEVSITAPVKMFDGRTVTKRLTVTIERGMVSAISAVDCPEPCRRAASPSTPPR